MTTDEYQVSAEDFVPICPACGATEKQSKSGKDFYKKQSSCHKGSGLGGACCTSRLQHNYTKTQLGFATSYCASEMNIPTVWAAIWTFLWAYL
eukprot:g25084.t1